MFLQELNAQHHDNIIRLLNVLKADNDKDIYLVFEYMGEFNRYRCLRSDISLTPISPQNRADICVIAVQCRDQSARRDPRQHPGGGAQEVHPLPVHPRKSNPPFVVPSLRLFAAAEARPCSVRELCLAVHCGAVRCGVCSLQFPSGIRVST